MISPPDTKKKSDDEIISFLERLILIDKTILAYLRAKSLDRREVYMYSIYVQKGEIHGHTDYLHPGPGKFCQTSR